MKNVKSLQNPTTINIYDKLLEHDLHFQTIDKRLDSIEKRLTNVEKRLDVVEKRLDAIENRLITIESRLYKVETTLKEIDERTALIPKLYDNVDKLIGEILENRQEHIFTNNRLLQLEQNIKK